MQVAQPAKSSAAPPGAPIKVLHLGYGARGGGVGRVVSDVACEMQRRGFECSVVFFGVYPAFSGYMDPLKAPGIPTYDLVKTPGLDVRGIRAIGTILRRKRPDVIISHGVAAGAYRLILRLTAGSQAKWIVVDHDSHYDPVTRTLKSKAKYAVGATLADRMVFVSEDNFQVAAKIYGRALRRKHKIVILNGIEVPKLAAGTAGHAEVPNLTMVAQFSKRKDQETLLRAFAIVRERTDARLWLVGDGIEAALKGLASDLRVERDVTFWGFQDREAVQELLRRTTVYCFTSQGESFGLAVLEAMALGLPVVACNVEGVRVLITDGATGSLARPADPDDLAQRIQRLLEDPVLRAKLGQAARVRVMAEFSLERCASAYGELVRGLVCRDYDPAATTAMRPEGFRISGVAS